MDKKPERTKSKNFRHQPDPHYWSCSKCFLDSSDENLSKISPSSSVQLYKLPKIGRNSNWSEHFKKNHPDVKEAISNPDTATKEAKKLVDLLNAKASRILGKFFIPQGQGKLQKYGEGSLKQHFVGLDTPTVANYNCALWLIYSGKSTTTMNDPYFGRFVKGVAGPAFHLDSGNSEARKEHDIYMKCRLLFQEKLNEAKKFFWKTFVFNARRGWMDISKWNLRFRCSYSLF